MSTTKNNQGIELCLFFNGKCDEALEFYRKALGAEIQMKMRFKDSPDQQHVPPGLGDKDCVQLPVYWSAKPKKL